MKQKQTKIWLLIGILFLMINQTRFSLGYSGKSAQTERIFVVNSGSMSVISLDPHMAFDGSTRSICDQVTEGLLLYNMSNPTNPFSLGLAASYTWVDALTLEFKLRENVTFHDGTPFDATAVKWNIDRSERVNFNYFGDARDMLEVTVDEYKKVYTHLDWALDGAKIPVINQTLIVDADTLQIVFNIPNVAEDVISMPTFNMLSPTAHAEHINKLLATDKLVGTGPFIFTEIDYAGDEIVFLGSEEYWDGAPYITRLIFKVIQNPQTLMNGIFEGSIDFASVPDTSYLDAIETNPDLDLIEGELSFTSSWLVLNTKTIEVEFRKAMSYAYNYSYILEEIDQYSVRSHGLLYPANKFYNTSIGLPEYNLTYAREILIESGKVSTDARTWSDQEWKDRASDDPIAEFEFLVWTYEDPYTNYQDLFRENMKLIGINIVENFVGLAGWEEIINDQELRETDMDSCWLYWGCPFPDATAGYLAVTFQTDATNNFANIADPTIDQWISEAAAALNPQTKQELMNQISNRIQNELYPYIFITQDKSFLVINANWEGYTTPFIATLFYYMHEKQSTNSSDDTSAEVSINAFPVGLILLTSFLGLNVIFICKKRRISHFSNK